MAAYMRLPRTTVIRRLDQLQRWPDRSPGPSLLHTRENAQFPYRYAKLPTSPTLSERGDTGIDHLGHFAGLTASVQMKQSI
jgi:hypothetical protein